MKVLVAGGTGFIGSSLCRELHDRGHEVTALSRNPDDGEVPAGVEVAMGDVTAYDSIAGAVSDQEAVINLVSLSPLFKTPSGTSHEEVHLGGTENLLQAAEEAGVSRFVQISGLGVDPNADTGYLRAKGRAEEVVRDSDIEWVIFRPSVVFGDGAEFVSFTKLVTTPYVTGLPGGGSTRFQPIWVEDLVPMIADSLEGSEHPGKTYEIGGPDQLTLAEVTKLVYESEGKPVRIVPVPMGMAKIGLTAAGPVPFVPLGPDQARSLEIDNVVESNDVGVFGVAEDDLRTFRSYLGLDSAGGRRARA